MEVSLIINDMNLYSRAGWVREEDILLARLLAGVSISRRLQTKDGIISVLRSIVVRMSAHQGRVVRVQRLIRGLSAMRKRFRIFERFIATPGVVYVVRRNRVHARRTYWRNLNGRVSNKLNYIDASESFMCITRRCIVLKLINVVFNRMIAWEDVHYEFVGAIVQGIEKHFHSRPMCNRLGIVFD